MVQINSGLIEQKFMRFSHICETFVSDTEKGVGQVIKVIKVIKLISGSEKPGVKTDVRSLRADRMARIIEVDSCLVSGDGMPGIIV